MKRLLIDLSSVVWTCLLADKDKEHGRLVEFEGKEFFVNSAQWGYDNASNHLKGVMDQLHAQPMQMIFVKEGMNSKAGRQALLPEYKSKRDRCPEQYEEFNKCCQMLLDTFLSLGAQCVWQDGVEADDVLGYLAKQLRGERWVVTNDKDLCQLIDPENGINVLRRGDKNHNPLGPFHPKYIPVYFALVGDSADKIPGAKGFGPKAFEDLLVVFGGDEGLEAMKGLIERGEINKLKEDVPELKVLQKVIDSREQVKISYELARLRIDKVNTLHKPLQWRVGMVKPRGEIQDSFWRKYGGQTTLVHKGNFGEALMFLRSRADASPWFAFDIETSTPPESDEWLEAQDKEEKVVDVFGSELTGFSITFGPNMQLTYYVTHDHVETDDVQNISIEQVAEMLEEIPREKITWVHNAQFELPVMYNELGERWKDDPEYHGFLRNVRDTRIASSYADENRKAGLKSLSEEILGYKQQTYQEITVKEFTESEWTLRGKPGKVLTMASEMDKDTMVRAQLKMNELTANEALSYGADDSICTAALANHFVTVMEIEDTVETFHGVETFPAYLTALGFVQGVDFDLAGMLEMQKEDDQAYDKAWQFLRQFLIDKGFEGTVCPVYTELSPANIKEVYLTVTGQELKTMVRTPEKLAKLIRQNSEDDAMLQWQDRTWVLAEAVEKNDLEMLNRLVKQHFKGEPKLDLASPKQMRSFLYSTVGIPIQIVNEVTPIERSKNPDLAEAAKLFRRFRMGKGSKPSDAQMSLLLAKAKTDDTAIDYAMAFDQDSLNPDSLAALHAVQTMKKVMTRRSLFYKNYLRVRHWKDGKIHSSMNQCAAVTRRYSSSGPNLQQLPKKGEGVKFRGFFKAHHKDAVICSVDYTGQELRLAAERSQDPNMLACYIGDQLKDIHSITAAGAMRLKWGDKQVDQLSAEYGTDLPLGLSKQEFEYRLFLKLRGFGKEKPIGKQADDLRKDSKNVNFAAQFGGQAMKLSETLIMKLEDAQLFLDARSEMFPLVDEAAKRAANFAEKHGYATTLMGARRHLRDSILSDDRVTSSAALRQAWNMEIQGSAGEMTKLGMTRLWKSGAMFKYDVRFFAPIHDELVTSVHKDHALEFIKIKHSCMTGSYATMRVPILGSISIGPDFAQQFECGDEYIPENIKAALDKIFKKEAVTA